MKAWYYNKVGMHNSWYLMLYDIDVATSIDVEKGKFGPEATVIKRHMDMPGTYRGQIGKLRPEKSLIWYDISKLKKHIIDNLITMKGSMAIKWIKQ